MPSWIICKKCIQARFSLLLNKRPRVNIWATKRACTYLNRHSLRAVVERTIAPRGDNRQDTTSFIKCGKKYQQRQWTEFCYSDVLTCLYVFLFISLIEIKLLLIMWLEFEKNVESFISAHANDFVIKGKMGYKTAKGSWNWFDTW